MQCDSRLSELSEPSELQLKAVEITVSSPKKLPAKAREDFNVGTSKIDMTKKSHGLNPLPMVNKTYRSKVMLNNIDAYLVFICGLIDITLCSIFIEYFRIISIQRINAVNQRSKSKVTSGEAMLISMI